MIQTDLDEKKLKNIESWAEKEEDKKRFTFNRNSYTPKEILNEVRNQTNVGILFYESIFPLKESSRRFSNN